MSEPFLIPKIPSGAEYYITPVFWSKHKDTGPSRTAAIGSRQEAFLNRIQIVDPRPKRWPRRRKQYQRFGPEILEIDDAIIRAPAGQILCSTAIFKSYHRHGGVVAWSKHLNDLREKIDQYDQDDRFHLRVYVGQSRWEGLHEAGLLKSKTTDFVKMKDSSTGWNIGNMWRILAMQDRNYEYVYFQDVHWRGDLEEHFGRIHFAFRDTDVAVAAALVPSMTKGRDYVTNFDDLDDWAWGYYPPVMYMMPPDMYVKTKIFEWYTRPSELPAFDLVALILYLFNKEPICQMYDPELNWWTYTQPYAQPYQLSDTAEQILFNLTPKLKMKLWIEAQMDWYREGYRRNGCNFFWKRLIEDLGCDLYYKNGEIFDWNRLCENS